MRLPAALVEAISKTMCNHGDWHLARRPERTIQVVDRPKWNQARADFKFPKLIIEQGSGFEFLDFHRIMVRQFKWLVENTPGHNFVFRPWENVPDWLINPKNPRGFTEDYLAKENKGTSDLINDKTSTADRLGCFLESTQIYLDPPGLNFHNNCHGLVAAYEYSIGSGYEGAEMDDFSTAHYNEHFWNLHGMLDNKYAQWQRNHGERVEQSPMDPKMVMGNKKKPMGKMQAIA